MIARTTLLLLALAALGCNGPFVLIPGGKLEGEALTVLPAWTPGDYGTAQLETHPEDPYSVNIAYTILGGQLYINAGDTETQWVKNLTANPAVRLRVDGVLYAARAERVTDDPAELDRVWLYRFVTP
jgi:hypothetical protein